MVHRNAGWRGSASSAGNTRGLNEEDSPRPERAACQRLKAVRSGTPAARRCRPLGPRRGSVRRGGSAAAGARASPWSASPGRGHGTPRSSEPAAQQPGTGPPPATARRGGQEGSARRRRAGKKGEHQPLYEKFENPEFKDLSDEETARILRAAETIAGNCERRSKSSLASTTSRENSGYQPKAGTRPPTPLQRVRSAHRLRPGGAHLGARTDE